MAHVSDSDAEAVGVGDGFNREEIAHSQSRVLDFAAGGKSFAPSNSNEKIAAMEEEKEEEEEEEEEEGKQKEQQTEVSLNDKIDEDSALEVELKKKRLLEELESVLLPISKDDLFSLSAGKTVQLQLQQHLPLPVRSSLGIEVIDETALVEIFPAPASASASASVGLPKKTTNKDNGKQSRRRAAKKDARHSHGRNVTLTITEETAPNEIGTKTIKNTKYSRKEMEALRFVNVAQQRKFWKAIYQGLQSVVAKEYDSLATTHPHNHNRIHPPQCLPNKKQAPSILSAVCCENMDSELQLMESSENVSPVDPSCSRSLMGEGGCSILEESSEDDDSEDDYASIQRPAFLVEGEPNFDSGPPEDGWEYLRRVRWEAHQIPKVKVAKLERSKLNKEQSAYMPKIPDIAKCPEHLLPLKQWEDVFLAEFSALRANVSCFEGSNTIYSSNLQPVHSLQLLGNNFGESASLMNRDVLLHHHLSIGKATDQPTNLTVEDKDTTLPPENPGSKTSIDQTSSSSPTLPLLSAILRMDSVARVSMLLKRISLLEPANTVTRNDCMWLFALCAAVDAPLDADTCAALRSLLRKCASIRAGKIELDEEVVMLNILATISGRYFGQSET